MQPTSMQQLPTYEAFMKLAQGKMNQEGSSSSKELQ
jgi:hypothetical protein